MGFTLEARRLKLKVVRDGVSLNDISLFAHPGDFIILAGAEGAGKLNLIQALAGLRRLHDGQIMLDGNNLSERMSSFRSRIGFVPRQDVASEDLTVFEALYKTAGLRLGNLPPQEQRKRVEEVLEDIGLAEHSRTRIGSLNFGQRKRVNIGIELVTEPGILFLDEPTLSLDASQGLEVVRLLQRLAGQGSTVIMTERSAQYLMLADSVAFLSHGSLVWYGPPTEVLEYFSASPSKIAANSTQADLAGVIGLLEDPEQESPEEWARRFQVAPAYKQYALPNSKNKKVELVPDERPLERLRAQATDQQRPTKASQVSGIKQFFILFGRNFTLLRRNRTSLFLVLALPLLLGSLDLLFSDRQMYDVTGGDPARISLSLALLVFFALLVGGASWLRDFPREAGFFQRERQVSLKLLPYVLSKVLLIALLALYQAVVWTGIHYFVAGLSGGFPVVLNFFVTLALTAFLGGIFGLIASVSTFSERQALLVFSIFLIPQLIFSNALFPRSSLNLVSSALTTIMPGRFAYEALSTADGHGRDLALDPCWQLPKAQRDTLVDQQKQVCTCLGSNIFKTCSFPGIRRFYTSQLDQPQPVQPDSSKISQFPVQPSLRPGETLEQYSQEVSAYTLQLESYQSDTGFFFQKMRQFMADYNAWETARNTAISKAEGQLEYQFVNFAAAYNVNLVNNWLILSGIILFFIILLMFLLRGKEMA